MHKRLLTVLLLTLLAVGNTFAQRWDLGDNYIGVRLGYNVTNLALSGMDVDKSPLSNLSVGVVYGVSLDTDMPLYFEPGVLISGKGVKIDAGRNQEKVRTQLTYLEVPFVFKYKCEDIAEDVSIEPFLGGFASIGLAGKTKYYDVREKQNSFRSGAFRRFDAGLRIGCGVAYKNFYIDLSYDLGLANVASNRFSDFGYDDFDDAIRTRCFSLSIGLDF